MRRAPRQLRQTRTRKSGCGCSGCGTLLLLLVIAGVIIGWPIYLKNSGTRTSGAITEKFENVRIIDGNWFRSFEITADYSIPGQSVQHRAACDVDEKTYDSLHRGDSVVVYYFANLLSQPFIPATRLSPCTTMASINLNPSVTGALIVALVVLLGILFLWRVLRIRIAAWLLLPWACLTFAYLVLPHAEPEPQHPVSATATVDTITTVTTIGGRRGHRAIDLPHPYEIVRLKYTPAGMDAPVVAIDKVDEGSVPNLIQGQTLAIVYDAGHPRIARLQGGTRSFPGQARTIVVLIGAAFLVLLVVLALIRGLFGLPGRFVGKL